MRVDGKCRVQECVSVMVYSGNARNKHALALVCRFSHFLHSTVQYHLEVDKVSARRKISEDGIGGAAGRACEMCAPAATCAPLLISLLGDIN